jgi:hypothetical protein
MPSKLDQLVLDRQRVAVWGPAVPATGVIFTIAGGPVWILGFFMYTVLIQNTAATITVTCSGYTLDAGAFNFNCAAGQIRVWRLQAAATVVAAMTPMPATADLAVAHGILAAPAAADNTIAMVVAGAPVNPVSFHCIYYAMTPAAQLI